MANDRPQDSDRDGGVQGEGDYAAARRYQKDTERFIGAGKVDEAARRAKPGSKEEARELEDAEQEARTHSSKTRHNG